MRKVLGPVLLGLGAFLLVVAVVAVTWAPGAVMKTPLDVNSKTFLSGEARRFDGSQLGSPVPISLVSITQADADASDDDVVVFINGSCVVEDLDGDAPECVDGDDPRLVTASEDTFAMDRKTALAVDGEGYLPDDAEPHEGLINKWPFDSEKKTYPYWDGTTGEAVDAEFVAEESLEGVDAYQYRVNIDEAPIEIAEGTPGTYTNEVNIWVEPRTGTIVKQSQDQQRYLEDGTQVLDLQAEFTEEQVREDTSEAADSKRQLDLLTSTVPLIGFIVGPLVIIVGIALLLLGRRGGRRRADSHASAPVA